MFKFDIFSQTDQWQTQCIASEHQSGRERLQPLCSAETFPVDK
jgi:hypothetical protein